MLVRYLPRESATVRAVEGDAARWSTTDYLLAALIDAVRAGNWQRGGGKGAKPKPFPRPKSNRGRKRYGRTKRSPREVARFLARFAPPPKGGDADGG